MKTKFILTALIGFYIFQSSTVMAQISKQEAVDTILNYILTNEEIEKSNIYLCDSIVVLDSLQFYDNEKIILPYDSNWVFFIDSLPLANWDHECFYLFMNFENGSYQTVGELRFPQNLNDYYEKVSFAYEIEEGVDTTTYVYEDLGVDNLAVNDNYYAVLLGGDATNRYTRDLEHIFLALTKRYGYKKENIFVHFIGCEPFFNVDLDGDDESDFDFLTSEEEIERTFLNLAGLENTVPSIPKLKHKDQLFIYSTGHGGVDESTWNSYLKKIYFEDYTFYMSEIYDYTFAQYLENINCSNITMVMNECYSGGFINDIIDVSNALCKNRIINTACKIDEKSWEEYWITIRKYDEFVFYWTDAVRGIYPDPVEYHAWFELTTTGTFPFNNYFPSSVIHPDDYDPDLDNDGFIQLGEAFHYANDFDSRSQYGFFCPPNANNAHWENPQDSINISFREDLLTLAGFAGEVENTQTIANRSYLIGGELKIKSGVTLTVSDSASFYLGNENAVITVDSGASLILGDNVAIYGDSLNKITINGTIQMGENDSLIRLGNEGYFDGLYLNESTGTNINNAYFEYTRLHHYGDSLVIDSTEFKDCYSINSYDGDVTVTYCDFDDTRLYLEIDVPSTDRTAIIRYNDFHTSWDTTNAVNLNDYDDYFIEYNEIEGYYSGIQVMLSGGGSAGAQEIVENDISGCFNNGIMVYGSTASVEKNIVYDCEFGVRFNNRSSVDFYGDSQADTTYETQYIHDNHSYEVYASYNSFPRSFEYNVIIDEDNNGNPYDPLVFFNTRVEPSTRDVENNCWGDDFDFWEDLYPQDTGFYDYEPTWCPSGSKKKSGEQSLFVEALNLFELGNYSQAETKFLQVVNEHPTTLFAQEALKELFRLEKFSGNDYTSLKQYYNTNTTIQENITLQYVGDFLGNKCDMKLENWQSAIDWYEYHIQYPNSLEDSVFAIIDLGYLYMLMENGGEKSYSGSMQEHIPYSEFQFFAKRDYLLSLLPGEQQSDKPSTDQLYGLQAGELLQNSPNPFSHESTIYFKLIKPAAVAVKLFDNMGIMKYQFKNSYMPEGTHNLVINANDFASGVYNYILEINGKKADVKRMVVLK